jgi:hypothetical protein
MDYPVESAGATHLALKVENPDKDNWQKTSKLALTCYRYK